MRPQIGMYVLYLAHNLYEKHYSATARNQCCCACKRGRFCDNVEDHFLSDKSRDKHYVLSRNSPDAKVLYSPNKKTEKYLILIKNFLNQDLEHQ